MPRSKSLRLFFANTIAGGLKTYMFMLVGLYVDIFIYVFICVYTYFYISAFNS